MMVQPLLLVVYSPGEGSRRFDGTGHGLQLQCAYNRHRAAGYLLSSLFYSMVNNNVELPKVLCLGMSYTNLPLTIQEKRCVAMTSKPDEAQLPPLDMSGTNTRPSVKAVIDNVKLGNLTAIDGRDLARCRATEVHCCVDVYTVSQEKAAVYEPSRHLEANFNRPAFVSALQKKFGGANPAKFQFDQVILDYFWIPPGWDQNHWSRGFFSTTLSDFAQHNLLKRAAASSQIQSGVIYLPFCFHCFRQVMANWDDSLRKYYDLSFLRTGDKDLYQITLWAGTQQIDSFDMRESWLVLGSMCTSIPLGPHSCFAPTTISLLPWLRFKLTTSSRECAGEATGPGGAVLYFWSKKCERGH